MSVNNFLKHSSIYAIGNIINRVGAFLLLPVYLNYLSLEEFGIVELFYVVLSISSGFLSAGIAHSTLRFYFDYDSEEDRKKVVTTNLIFSFCLVSLGAILLVLSASTVSDLMFDSDVYVHCIYIIALNLVLEMSSQVCLAYIRATERSFFFVILSVVKLIVQVSVNSYLVIVEEMGITGVLIGNCSAVAMEWIILTTFTISKCGFGFKTSILKPTLHYAYPFLLSATVGIVSNNTSRILIGKMVSLEALGLFALASKISQILEILVGEPFNRSYGAYRFSIMNEPNAGSIQARITVYLVLLLGFMTTGMLLYSEFILDLLTSAESKDFVGAAELLPLLLLTSCFVVGNYPLQTGILYAKKTKLLLYVNTICAVVGVVASVILVYLMGVQGVCLALLLTEMCRAYLTNRLSQPFFKVSYDGSSVLWVFALSAIVYVISQIFVFNAWWAEIAVNALLLVCFVLVCFAAPILEQNEKTKVLEFISKRRKKKASA